MFIASPPITTKYNLTPSFAKVLQQCLLYRFWTNITFQISSAIHFLIVAKYPVSPVPPLSAQFLGSFLIATTFC